MTRDLTQVERDTLEAIIDCTSVKAMLEAISDICGAKEEHLISNWQDEKTARIWAEACGHVGCASVDVCV
jgi:hypothetical protein